MKPSGILILPVISGIVIAACVVAESNTVASAHSNYCLRASDSADIIINKYIDALGGKEKLESIRNVYMEGTVLIRGQKMVSKTWVVNNKESRSEYTNNGFTNWSILHTDSAWSYNPRRGQKSPEPWPAERVKTSQNNLDIAGPLVDYKTKGYTVEYKGIEQIEGSDTYKIEVKLNNAVTKMYYIDLDSFLIIRVSSKFTTPTRTSYASTDYSNYQKTKDGYIFPMEAGNVKYTRIDVNTDIDETLFTPTKINH